ncbi:MAG: transporter substrate-binding domain-containing protein [Rhodospirillales bacterium]|nr:transporter substrate-binding domain-containing protein [Rhodospirillales bacterium]
MLLPETKGRRRVLFALGGVGVAAAITRSRRGHAAEESLLQKVLARGRVIVGTGSANAPWHFKNVKGALTGMDIAMARILAKGLFDDGTKVEYVLSSAAARIPNLTTGKVDVVINFMTVTPGRAQLVAFTRPYYVEAGALLTLKGGKTYDQLAAMGKRARISVLQNVYSTRNVHQKLPKASVEPFDTPANVIQALDSDRADAASIDLSSVRWLVRRFPNHYADAAPGRAWNTQLYSAAVPLGEPDWLHFVDTAFQVAMFSDMTGHGIYVSAFEEFFGERPPPTRSGFPSI